MNVDDITSDRVREVLRHMSRDRTAGRTALAGLVVVRRALEDAGFQPTPAACQYEVGRLLADLVERELEVLRRRAGRPPGELPPAAALRADFGCGLRELEAWSAMYHLYLRPDLELGLKGLTGLLDDRHRRTVQRRLRRGAVALTARVQALEREAGLSERHEALAARVPEPATSRLVGVDGLLRRAGERLRDPTGPAILALRGPGGIGKTALAQALARDAVGETGFEDVAWLAADVAAPVAVAVGAAASEALLVSLARQLDGAASADATPAAVRSRLRRRRTLVVVDGLDDPAWAAAAVRALRAVGGASRAVVTGRLGWSAWGDVQVLDVPALQPAAAIVLLRHEAAARGLTGVAEASDEALAPVVAASRGHPLAIRLAAGQLRADDAVGVARAFAAGEGVAAALCRDLWDPAWARATPGAHTVVRAAVGAGTRAIPRTRLVALAGLPPDTFTAALASAVDLGLLEPTGDARAQSFRVPVFLRRFLRQAL
jgi:hypothetical protein